MRKLRSFLGDPCGTTAAEFALILPIALLFLLGLIDVGRYAWSFNKMEKATQIGARWAAATTLIPGGTGTGTTNLYNYSFVINEAAPQGDPVSTSMFPGIACRSTGCVCKSGGTCKFTYALDSAAFTALVSRMNRIHQGIAPADVQIDYDNVGLGFAGDPNGPDVHPLITVSVKNKRFPMWFMLGRTVRLPEASYALTAEDMVGTVSN